MAPSDAAIHYRRRNYSFDGRTLASFTVPQEMYTYIILAEFGLNKWVPFWSYKVLNTDYDEEFFGILSKELVNVQNFYNGTAPTSDSINDQVQDIAFTL